MDLSKEKKLDLTQEELTERWGLWTPRQRAVYMGFFERAKPYETERGQAAGYAAYRVEVDLHHGTIGSDDLPKGPMPEGLLDAALPEGDPQASLPDSEESTEELGRGEPNEAAQGALDRAENPDRWSFCEEISALLAMTLDVEMDAAAVEQRLFHWEEPFKNRRLAFLAELDEGTTCPCCGRFAKRYKRKLNSGMARAAVWFYREYSLGADEEPEWFNMEESLRDLIASEPETPRSGDPAKLRFWDLLEASEKNAGVYRLTPKGVRFVLGQIRVPRHCTIYNDKREGFSDDSTDIREALEDHFDYDQLMGA